MGYLRTFSGLVVAATVSFALSAQAAFNAWVYEYGSDTPVASQQSWDGVNLVDTTAGVANATFSGALNNEKYCFDGKLNIRRRNPLRLGK